MERGHGMTGKKRKDKKCRKKQNSIRRREEKEEEETDKGEEMEYSLEAEIFSILLIRCQYCHDEF